MLSSRAPDGFSWKCVTRPAYDVHRQCLSKAISSLTLVGFPRSELLVNLSLATIIPVQYKP